MAGARDGVRANPVSVLRQEIDALGLGCLSTGVQTVEIYFFIIKPTRCTNFTNLFWHETLHVLDISTVHHQEFIHCTLSNGICHTYTIAECAVNKLLMMDSGTVRNM